MDEAKYSLIFACEGISNLLVEVLQSPYEIVTSPREFVTAGAKDRRSVAYVDIDLLPQIEGETNGIPVIGVVDGSLDAIVRALAAFPWLSHVVTTSMLSTPAVAAPHLSSLVGRFRDGPESPIIGTEGVGRVALLTHSVRRESRIERMREFFAAQHVSSRTLAVLGDVAEELVTNALYDAPAEAGFFSRPVPRTKDIELPTEHACEISYGLEDHRAFVRVRDPFGALTRQRLLGVLKRCNVSGVSLDESRGGAGLGLWRVFSAASTIAITVLPGRLTDILVWVEVKKARAAKQLLATHMFFPCDHELDGAQSWFAADHDDDLIDESFTAVIS